LHLTEGVLHAHGARRASKYHDHVDACGNEIRKASKRLAHKPSGAIAHDRRPDPARDRDAYATTLRLLAGGEKEHEVPRSNADVALLDPQVVSAAADTMIASGRGNRRCFLPARLAGRGTIHQLLLVDSGRQAMSSLETASLKHFLSGLGGVALSKTVRAGTALVVRLIGTFAHRSTSKGRAVWHAPHAAVNPRDPG
jgi:hypothetical protein